jgi:hypothetical protein
MLIFRALLKLDGSHEIIFIYFVLFIWLKFKSALRQSRMRWNVVTMYCSVIHCSSGFFLRSLVTAIWLFDSNGEPLVSWRGLPSLHTLKRNRNHAWEVGAYLCSVRVGRQRLCWSHCKTQLDKTNKQFYYSSGQSEVHSGWTGFETRPLIYVIRRWRVYILEQIQLIWFFNDVSVLRLYSVVWTMNWRGIGRKWSWRNQGMIPEFAWRG